MSLEELLKAVERYRKKDGPNPPINGPIEVVGAACTIADCLTDSTPITRERLEALGFEPIDGDRNRIRLGIVVVNYHSSPDGVFFCGCVAAPHPQTMGDVAYLLLRPSREEHQ